MNFKIWLLLTETKKSSDIARELLGNNEALFNQIKSDIPTDIKQDLQAKLLPIAAYYYKQQPDLNILKQDIKDYTELVIKQKMPIITVNDDTTISNEFKDYLHWTQVIHGKQAEDRIINAPIPQGNLEDQELLEKSPDGRIKVYKANSVNQCIILGKGESFCISQPSNTMFQSYRDTRVSTFYFVYDNTRTDDLAIVVVDATKYGIQLTDRKNKTAETMQDPYSNVTKRIKSDPQLYFKYLKQHGIDTNIFVNIPKSEEEEAEQRKLGKQKHYLQWFKSLTLEEISKYIGRGHELSNEQFNYLYDNRFMFPLTQYVRTGRQIPDYQLEKVANVRDLKDKYLHNRLIADQHKNDLSKKEYDLLSPQQKEEFFNINNAFQKYKKAMRVGELEKLKEAVKNGAEIDFDSVLVAAVQNYFDILKYLVEEKGAFVDDYVISYAASNGNLDVVKYLVKKGLKINDYAADYAIQGGHLDMVKYLVEKGKNISEHAVFYAASNGHLDMVKYLVEEKKLKIGNRDVFIAAENGHLDVVKYLAEEKKAKIDDTTVTHAAAKGHLDIVKYLVENGANIDDNAVSGAAKSGNLDIVKYLVGKNAVINNYAIAFAADKGNLDIVEYLFEKGANIGDGVNYAVKSGYLDIVKYLVEKDAKINNDAVESAIQLGHLDIIRYLVDEKGEKMPKFSIITAIKFNRLNVVTYLVDEKGKKISNYAIKNARTQEMKDYLVQKQKEQK